MTTDDLKVYVETLDAHAVLGPYADEIEASEAMDQWNVDEDDHKIVWRNPAEHAGSPPPKCSRCGGLHMYDEACSRA